jgi:hypothetical protein
MYMLIGLATFWRFNMSSTPQATAQAQQQLDRIRAPPRVAAPGRKMNMKAMMTNESIEEK